MIQCSTMKSQDRSGTCTCLVKGEVNELKRIIAERGKHLCHALFCTDLFCRICDIFDSPRCSPSKRLLVSGVPRRQIHHMNTETRNIFPDFPPALRVLPEHNFSPFPALPEIFTCVVPYLPLFLCQILVGLQTWRRAATRPWVSYCGKRLL